MFLRPQWNPRDLSLFCKKTSKPEPAIVVIRGQVVAAGNGPVREGSVMPLMSSLRGWPVWQLPQWLAACVTAVVAAYAVAVAWALAGDGAARCRAC
jgi:hypothetical protein